MLYSRLCLCVMHMHNTLCSTLKALFFFKKKKGGGCLPKFIEYSPVVISLFWPAVKLWSSVLVPCADGSKLVSGTHQPTLQYSASCHIHPCNSCGDAFAAFLAGITIWSRVHHRQPGLCLFPEMCRGCRDRVQMAAGVFLGKLPLVKMSLIDVGEEFLSHMTPSPVLLEYNERDCRKMQKDVWMTPLFFFFKRQRKGVQARLDYFQSHCTCVDSPLSAATSSLQRARGRAGAAGALIV